MNKIKIHIDNFLAKMLYINYLYVFFYAIIKIILLIALL